MANPTTATKGTTNPSKPVPTKDMTYGEVENAWIQAGGNPQAAAMAAAVADASSGLNPAVSRTNPDGTTSVGLWLIPKNGTPPGTTDPVANARAAVQLSNNGSDWQQWCVTWSDNNCGLDQGTYLGEGSNALASLAQRLSPSSYNVIGSAPSGTNQGASAATASTSGTSSTGSSSHSFLLVGLLILVVIVVIFIARRAQSTAPLEEVPNG